MSTTTPAPFTIRYTPEGRILNDPRIVEAMQELLDNSLAVVIDRHDNGNFRMRTILGATEEKFTQFETLVEELTEEWGAGPDLVTALRYALGVNLGSSNLESQAAIEHRSFDAPCDVDELPA